ncbi:MAG: sugar phosphate nucleotidyltransferase, partial [Bacteroidales bacterium]
NDGRAALSAAQESNAPLGIKALIPIGDRPFLAFVISGLADAGYEQVCLVVAPDADLLVSRYSGAAAPTRVRVSFAVQREARGTADAVLAARDFVGDDLFLVINSDNYYSLAVLRALRLLGRPGLVGFDREALVRGGNIDPERIARFALLEVRPNGDLARIVEKPDAATLAAMGPHAPISMNCWMFGPAIFSACAAIEPSPRGELELAAAVEHAIAGGERFAVIPLADTVLDMTSRADIASVTSRLATINVRL